MACWSGLGDGDGEGEGEGGRRTSTTKALSSTRAPPVGGAPAAAAVSAPKGGDQGSGSDAGGRAATNGSSATAPPPPAMIPRDASSSADARAKCRKRSADPSPSKQSAAADDAAAALHAAAAANGGGGTLDGGGGDLREAGVLPAAERITAFPAASGRVVNRLHPSVLAVVEVESSAAGPAPAPSLDNISHGLSSRLPDGVPKQFGDKLLMVPRHSDWFSPMGVHRLERQLLPQFFSGKSPGHTPEKYMVLRNRVIAKYLEHPEKRLAFSECQGLVIGTPELYDLSRIVSFLDAWGIINYLAVGSVQRGLRMAATLIREEPTGELHLMSAPLKSIDGLILFDRPKCSVRAEVIASVASISSSPGMANGDAGFADLDEKTLLERLSESFCSICAQPLPSLHYESQKEVDIALCSDCFHDARFVTGHTGLDFQRADGKKDGPDNDGDSWTDQETFLLLEGMDKYNKNWNAVAEHVGTKSKIQCVHHFLRLPVEDGLLDSIKVPEASISLKVQNNGFLRSDSNGSTSGSFPQSGEAGHLPLINTANPVMSLAAFPVSSVGPRVAPSCASAAVSVLTNDDFRISSKRNDVMGHSARPNCDSSSAVSSENARHAAMCGLSAAATKRKLFVDKECEIQRLTATIINHQKGTEAPALSKENVEKSFMTGDDVDVKVPGNLREYIHKGTLSTGNILVGETCEESWTLREFLVDALKTTEVKNDDGIALKSNKFAEEFMLPIPKGRNGHYHIKRSKTTPLAHVLFDGLLEKLHEAHKNDLSWGGNISQDTIKFVNGKAVFTEKPTEKLNGTNASQDYKVLCCVFKECCFLNGQLPIYMKNLCYYMNSTTLRRIRSRAHSLFLRIHPAIMPYTVRSPVFWEIKRDFDVLSVAERYIFINAIRAVRMPPRWMDFAWREPIFAGTFNYSSYKNTPLSCFNFIRNWLTHGAKRFSYNHRHIFTSENMDYLVEYYFPDFLPDLLFELIDEGLTDLINWFESMLPK